MDAGKKSLNETIINGSKVFVDNGKVQTILNDEIIRTGYMSVDELYNLVDANISMIYGLKDELSS